MQPKNQKVAFFKNVSPGQTFVYNGSVLIKTQHYDVVRNVNAADIRTGHLWLFKDDTVVTTAPTKVVVG